MGRTLAGVALLLHGLAHAYLGIWAGAIGPLWIVTPLWTIAMTGFLMSGFGLLRVPLLSTWWLPILGVATLASLALHIAFGHQAFMAGLIVDIVVLSVLIRRASPGVRFRDLTARLPKHPALARTGTVATVLVLAYVATASAARPLFIRWGSTEADRIMLLPGDSLPGEARYRLDHAITIRAPADSVWPWLVQIGQDRGGFYSYDWLERLAGAGTHNADRIHLEWQQVNVGDFVRAVPPGWLGGRFGDSVGWRVSALRPGRAIVLRNWGVFALITLDSASTRLIVRTRSDGTPSARAVILGPIAVFAFEPAHFIMQRGMMRGIRDRAEGRRS